MSRQVSKFTPTPSAILTVYKKNHNCTTGMENKLLRALLLWIIAITTKMKPQVKVNGLKNRSRVVLKHS